MSKHNNHPITIPGYKGSIEDLAKSVENLRYDALEEFLECLKENLYERSEADYDSGKTKLSKTLSGLASDIESAAIYAYNAWSICKPYMKD